MVVVILVLSERPFCSKKEIDLMTIGKSLVCKLDLILDAPVVIFSEIQIFSQKKKMKNEGK